MESARPKRIRSTIAATNRSQKPAYDTDGCADGDSSAEAFGNECKLPRELQDSASYSYRNATSGSTWVARRAGSQQAARAQIVVRAITARIVRQS